MRNSNLITVARCRCGQVGFEATGRPILAVACYCDSCRKAAVELESLPEAQPILRADTGTDFLLYRKDRVRPAAGADRLREHRLGQNARTRRVVAACCNSPMFLEFEHGHWLSLYRDRFDPEARPPVEMRTMTGDLGPDVRLDDSLPSPAGHTPAFMWKLMKAWAAMGFRAPRVEYVQGVVGR